LDTDPDEEIDVEEFDPSDQITNNKTIDYAIYSQFLKKKISESVVN
jgi:hypothetical protein